MSCELHIIELPGVTHRSCPVAWYWRATGTSHRGCYSTTSLQQHRQVRRLNEGYSAECAHLFVFSESWCLSKLCIVKDAVVPLPLNAAKLASLRGQYKERGLPLSTRWNFATVSFGLLLRWIPGGWLLTCRAQTYFVCPGRYHNGQLRRSGTEKEGAKYQTLWQPTMWESG